MQPRILGLMKRRLDPFDCIRLLGFAAVMFEANLGDNLYFTLFLKEAKVLAHADKL